MPKVTLTSIVRTAARSIRTTLITVFVILLLLLLGSVFTMQLLVDVQTEGAAAAHRRYESYRLAVESSR